MQDKLQPLLTAKATSLLWLRASTFASTPTPRVATGVLSGAIHRSVILQRSTRAPLVPLAPPLRRLFWLRVRRHALRRSHTSTPSLPTYLKSSFATCRAIQCFTNCHARCDGPYGPRATRFTLKSAAAIGSSDRSRINPPPSVSTCLETSNESIS